jgi:hypothetical protein
MRRDPGIRACAEMTKDQELVWFERRCSVRVAAIELNLVATVEEFHDGTDRAAHEAVRGHIREQGDNVKQLWRAMHRVLPRKQAGCCRAASRRRSLCFVELDQSCEVLHEFRR